MRSLKMTNAINTKAREMLEKMGSLKYLSPEFEEMTQHPMMAGMPMNFPSNYRGLAKVTRVRDEQAKSWLGMDMPIYVDMESGETNLFAPNGQMASVADISKWFDLETFEPHP